MGLGLRVAVFMEISPRWVWRVSGFGLRIHSTGEGFWAVRVIQGFRVRRFRVYIGVFLEAGYK